MSPLDARLLLIDESETMRRVACECLREAGFVSIEQATDESVLLQPDPHEPYDVVVTPYDLTIAGTRRQCTSGPDPSLVEQILGLLGKLGTVAVEAGPLMAAVSPALLSRAALLERHEAEAERVPVACLARHYSDGVPGCACACGLTLLAPSQAVQFDAIALARVLRGRRAEGLHESWVDGA